MYFLGNFRAPSLAPDSAQLLRSLGGLCSDVQGTRAPATNAKCRPERVDGIFSVSAFSPIQTL